MKLTAPNIFGLIRGFAGIAVLMSMLIQPIAEGIAMFTDNAFELTVLDMEEDQEKEEKKENDNKKEKIEAPGNAYKIQGLAYLSESSSHEVQQLLWDYDLEILIPPPRLSI